MPELIFMEPTEGKEFLSCLGHLSLRYLHINYISLLKENLLKIMAISRHINIYVYKLDIKTPTKILLTKLIEGQSS